MKQVVLNARKLFANSGGVYIALAVLLAVCSVSNEYFRNPQNLANITRQLSEEGINVENMTNKSKGDYAYTMVDINAPAEETALTDIRAIPGVIRLRVI